MPTDKELEQIQAAAAEAAKAGDDRGAEALRAIYDLVTGVDPGPQES